MKKEKIKWKMCTILCLLWYFIILFGSAYYSVTIKSYDFFFLFCFGCFFEHPSCNAVRAVRTRQAGKYMGYNLLSYIATRLLILRTISLKVGFTSGSKTRIYPFCYFVKLHAQLPLEFSFLMMLSSFWTAVLTFVKF